MKHRHEVQVVKRTLDVCCACRLKGSEKEREKKARQRKRPERKKERVRKKNRNIAEEERKPFQGYWLITLAGCIEARLLTCRIANELRRIDWMHRSVSRRAEHFGEKVRRPYDNEDLLCIYIRAGIQFRRLNYEESRQKPEERSAESGK